MISCLYGPRDRRDPGMGRTRTFNLQHIQVSATPSEALRYSVELFDVERHMQGTRTNFAAGVSWRCVVLLTCRTSGDNDAEADAPKRSG